MKNAMTNRLIVLVLAVLAAGAGWAYMRSRKASSADAGGPAAETGQRALEIGDGDMESLKTGVVLVDFWATWCPPCRTQGPIVDALAGRFSGRAVVAKLNVDEAKKTAASYGVRSIPTLILFRDGREVERFVGLQTEAKLAAAIEKQLADG